MSRSSAWALVGLVASATPALAHTGYVAAFGAGEGILHPLGGLDHVLAMVAVGLLAAQLGGRAVWALPLAFLIMMAAGGWFGISGHHLPLAEVAIALSTVAFGAAIAFRLGLPVALGTMVLGAFAVFHGHAHGAEMPDSVLPIGYAVGFLAATALLHGAGLMLGWGLARVSSPRLIQAAGGGVAVAGLVLLARLV